MRISRPALDYSMCNQSIAVFRLNGDTVTKTIIPKAFLDFKKVQTTEKIGQKETNSFLLVIPNESLDNPVKVGDKVLLGDADIRTREEWAKFIPSLVPNLVVVKWVDPKYSYGVLVHWEAGG